jgi:hypothetical protein
MILFHLRSLLLRGLFSFEASDIPIIPHGPVNLGIQCFRIRWLGVLSCLDICNGLISYLVIFFQKVNIFDEVISLSRAGIIPVILSELLVQIFDCIAHFLVLLLVRYRYKILFRLR